MRIYHVRCTMNLKAAFALILTVLVIFGYSFYRYFYRHEYPVKFQISNTVSSGKVFERDEVLVEPLSTKKGGIIARTTPKTSTKERSEQRQDINEINFLPNTESEEKARKEFFEQMDELSRRQGINVTDGTDERADNETLLNENRTKEYNMDEFMNTSKTFVGNGKAVVNNEEDEIEENRNLEIKNNNSLAEEVENALKKNGKDDEETELVQQNMVKLMSNLTESFDKGFYNVTSKNSSDILNTSEGLTRSNETLQDLGNSLANLSRKRGKSIVNLRKRKGRRIIKKNGQNIFKQRMKSKVKRKRHHGNKKSRRSKKKSSLSKDNILKSSLHEEGHNSKREQHKSIHPNKKMLTNLKTNFKIDYKEGYVLDETFFREAKLKPVYNIRNRRKRSVLLLHPSIFTSSVWVNIGTMQALAESGYRNIAIDLPGYGRSNSSKIPYSRSEIIDYMIQLIQYLGLEKPVIVTPSRSGDYVMPLIMSHPYMIGGFVAISPTDTSKYSRHFYENLGVPSLVVVGKEDTSMLNWASLDNLEHLKMRRIFTIANATKECYVDRPSSFHKLLLDFLPSLAIQTTQ